MEGRRSSTSSSYNRSRYQFEHNEDEIKKGPWKAEEDQVLLNHVKKYGPRDWSSIRSKGLLQRTGKSCRLRWVNKLRPNLKKLVHLFILQYCFQLSSLFFVLIICWVAKFLL